MISCAESAIPPQPEAASVYGPAPTRGPEKMDFHEKSRIRAAAHQATRQYPGPIGNLVARELLAVENWGYRVAQGCWVMELVNHLLNPPAPAS